MILYSATQEVIWLLCLLTDQEYAREKATTIYHDNQGCIALAKNSTRTKHIDIKFYFLREKATCAVIALNTSLQKTWSLID